MQFEYRRKPTFGEQLGAGLGAGVSQSIQKAVEGEQRKRQMLAMLPEEDTTKVTEEIVPTEKKPQEIEVKKEIFKKPKKITEEVEVTKPKFVGTREKLLTDAEIFNKAKKEFIRLNAAGVPTTEQAEINKILAKQNVIKAQRDREQGYVNESFQALKNIYKEASDEDRAGLANEFVDLNLDNLTEAERIKKIQSVAQKYSNQIADIQKNLRKKTWWTRGKDEMTPEQVQKELGKRVEFLVDRGMFDKARSILSKAGYFPEEIESLWGKLSGETERMLKSIPDKKIVTPGTYSQREKTYEEEKQLADSLVPEILKSDPKVNLVMLRQALMKKGIPSNVFLDALRTAEDDLSAEGFQFNEDQLKQIGKELQEPPIAGLGEILRKMGWK